MTGSQRYVLVWLALLAALLVTWTGFALLVAGAA